MEIEEAIHMLKSYSGMSKKLVDNTGRPKLDQAIEMILENRENIKADLHDMYKSYKYMEENWTSKANLNLYIRRDKIRDKIKEKEKEIQDFIETDNTERFTRDKCRITDEINALQELLEEEEK